ncbi:MAG: hypothetical protein JO001_26595 [Alphaproteobacteria bacterium]|nr:hypothetical protein [Alphaproteobacteria bacterium]
MMKEFFERALDNVIRHGDTDIFPYPFETLLFFDKRKEVLDLLLDIHANFKERLAAYPPAHQGALAPLSYTGFRWATQLDPIWNVYFPGLVIAAAPAIENARIPAADQMVFSYRYNWNSTTADLFDPAYHWRTFMECSLRKSENYAYVVIADISEFYLRLSHHRLENALK